jgi:hypothetical protein
MLSKACSASDVENEFSWLKRAREGLVESVERFTFLALLTAALQVFSAMNQFADEFFQYYI